MAGLLDGVTESFGRFASALNPGNLIGEVTGAASPNGLMRLAYGALVPTLLFLVLTPGFIVNVGGISANRCLKLVPLPSTATGSCNLSTGDYETGSGEGTGMNSTTLAPLCAAQSKCHKWWATGYTGPWPIALHTVVFLLLIGAVMYAMKGY